MLTQCPHCDASFRVTDAQLQAARGKVRCGACMKVFNAKEHMVAASSGTPAAQPARPEPASPKPAPPQKRSETDPPSKNPAPSQAGGIVSSDSFADDFIFQDDPDADKDDSEYTHKLIDESELSDSFRELAGGEQGNYLGTADDAEEVTQDESWAEQMLKDLEKPTTKPQAPVGAEAKASEEYFTSTGQPPPTRADTAINADVRPSQFDALRADPVSVRVMTEEQGSETFKKVFWVIAILGLLVFLIGQLAWFHFDTLARHDRLRPLYSEACLVLGCELPPLYDPEKIRSQNLVVRSHPLVNNALIIDAVIVNQASFDQPFPKISLRFSDINNSTVARRTFSATEYLSGEAQGLAEMPSRVPVHIALEILDPGKEAVNYALEFVPPESVKPAR